jgi:hypothetical protein
VAVIQVLTDLYEQTERSVTHLELWDTYGTSHPDFQDGLASVPVADIGGRGRLGAWNDLIRDRVARGVIFRRARVISAAPSDYIRFQHAITPWSNLARGEQVRWLERTKAKDSPVPSCDSWSSTTAWCAGSTRRGTAKRPATTSPRSPARSSCAPRPSRPCEIGRQITRSSCCKPDVLTPRVHLTVL